MLSDTQASSEQRNRYRADVRWKWKRSQLAARPDDLRRASISPDAAITITSDLKTLGNMLCADGGELVTTTTSYPPLRTPPQLSRLLRQLCEFFLALALVAI